MKTIVALVDFSEVTTKILKLAQTLATALRSQLVLLHVVPPEPIVATLGAEAPAIPEAPSPERVKAEQAQLQDLLDSLIMSGVSASALQFEGPVVATVMEEIAKLHADLVIMGAHRHNALYNFFIGSVAADLMKALPCAVLMMPADIPAEEGEPATKPLSPEKIQEKVMTQPVLTV